MLGMFVHHCTACERRQLIFPSQVTAVAETGAGMKVSFTCWCGAEQTVLAGARAAAPAKHSLAA